MHDKLFDVEQPNLAQHNVSIEYFFNGLDTPKTPPFGAKEGEILDLLQVHWLT